MAEDKRTEAAENPEFGWDEWPEKKEWMIHLKFRLMKPDNSPVKSEPPKLPVVAETLLDLLALLVATGHGTDDFLKHAAFKDYVHILLVAYGGNYHSLIKCFHKRWLGGPDDGRKLPPSSIFLYLDRIQMETVLSEKIRSYFTTKARIHPVPPFLVANAWVRERIRRMQALIESAEGTLAGKEEPPKPRKHVVAVVCADVEGRVLLAYNPRWRCYSFPLGAFRPDKYPSENVFSDALIAAFRKKYGLELRVEDLEPVAFEGPGGPTYECPTRAVSGRDGALSDYVFYFFRLSLDTGAGAVRRLLTGGSFRWVGLDEIRAGRIEGAPKPMDRIAESVKRLLEERPELSRGPAAAGQSRSSNES